MATRQITVRLDERIFTQIEGRSKILGTAVSVEIGKLLLWALDKQVEMDREQVKKMHESTSTSHR